MMAKFEIRTPALVESVSLAREVIDGLRSGQIDPRSAGLFLSGARVLQAAVAGDVKARLAAPRILAQEAKLVEDERSKTAPQAIEQQPAKTRATTTTGSPGR